MPQTSASAAAPLPSASSIATAEVARPKDPPCDKSRDVTLLVSPHQPWEGQPLRVLAVADAAQSGELRVLSDGKLLTSTSTRHGGTPYFWLVELPSVREGTLRIELESSCRGMTKDVQVVAKRPPNPRATWGAPWAIKQDWDRAHENLFSAWIEKLFDAPLDQQLSWPALHEVLRDRGRNLLHNHLGISEDEQNILIRPDCADLPYFLRAYFAFKLGLSFGYSACSRGGGGRAPTCPTWHPHVEGGKLPGTARGFGAFLRGPVADTVHSGSGRTDARDERTDYYPVAPSIDSIRPGTIYADPYGHVLIVTKRIAQTEQSAGLLLAVDGQPDGTVARKRFWRGNFLFALDPSLGSPGFKRFRPVVRKGRGQLVRMTNAEILGSKDYGDFSLAQYDSGVEGFYDKMDDVLSPEPLDPVRAMTEAIVALDEQVRMRVLSVDNGRKFQQRGMVADMPNGAAIFETHGAWEDFSTPSRDLRLLIAIDVVRGFPDRVARRPTRYAMPKDKTTEQVKQELAQLLEKELSARSFTYPRSDGSAWKLTMSQVVARARELEMAYNPNDCVELRWGAAKDSDEAQTCKRRASPGQRQKMLRYRAWFEQRKRPPRD